MANQQSEMKTLEVTVLQPNPFQPRNKLMKEDLEELAESIEQHGVLEPLLVAHTPAGYQIIAGERRWRAAQMAGLKEVPTLIKKCTPREMLEMALIENVQRTDLTPMERAHSFRQLRHEFGLTVSEISDKINKSASFISNSLRLLALPDAIKDGLVGGLITEGHARAIAGIDDKSAMIEAYKKILKEDASVRRAEEIARLIKSEMGQTKSKTKDEVYQVNNEAVKAWEKRLKALINTDAKVKLSRSSRQTRITITLKGKPEKTQEDLEKIMAITGS